MAHHPHVSVLGAALQAPGKPLQPYEAIQAASRQLELRPAIVQKPAQAVLDARALGDQVLAMIEQ
jgi:hypothetical protein